MKTLVTAFEPFGNISTNCTELVLRELELNLDVDTLLLPVEHIECFSKLMNKIEKNTYDNIILLGQASMRKRISIERVALNIYDFPIQDNSGNQIIDQRIIEDEENALFSTLPIKEILNDLKLRGIDSEISNSAGTYICNELFFKGLNLVKNTKTRLGFIHLPLAEEQNCINFTTAWSLSQLCLSLEVIINTCSKSLE